MRRDVYKRQVELSFDSSGLGGHRLVVFEKLLDAEGTVLAVHEDIEDEGQSVTVGEIGDVYKRQILYRTGHVGIYIGGDRYIHAPHRGEVVKIASGISSFTCALSYR